MWKTLRRKLDREKRAADTFYWYPLNGRVRFGIPKLRRICESVACALEFLSKSVLPTAFALKELPETALNAVEGFFAKLARRRLKRGVFHSLVDLQAAINRFVAKTNQNPKPFNWTADPDTIIAAVKRGYQALDSNHYEEIKKDQIPLYQKYLDGLFAVIDIDNYTLWSMSKEYDRERLKRDDRLIEKVCCEEAASHDLSPVCLQIVVNQYFFADPWLRERYRSTWVETVVYNAESVSFLPGAGNFWKILEAVNN